MPMTLRALRQLLKDSGFSISQTTKHWELLDKNGNQVYTFAVTHGKKTKRDEIKDFYIRQIKMRIKGGHK